MPSFPPTPPFTKAMIDTLPLGTVQYPEGSCEMARTVVLLFIRGRKVCLQWVGVREKTAKIVKF